MDAQKRSRLVASDLRTVQVSPSSRKRSTHWCSALDTLTSSSYLHHSPYGTLCSRFSTLHPHSTFSYS